MGLEGLDKKYNYISRRDAMKIIGLSPITASVLTSNISSTLNASEQVKLNGKIVIVGGGAGAIMLLSKLLIDMQNPDIIIIAPNDIHLYQPAQVYIGAGEMDNEDLFIDNNNYIDIKKVQWIKDKVTKFNPDKNTLITRSNQHIAYDYLIIATGLQYNYEEIKGLSEKDIGKNGITSVYLNDLEKGTAYGATATKQWFQELKEFAKTKKPKVIYTHPNTPIKSSLTPQSILYLSADYLKQNNLDADYNFITSKSKLFYKSKIDKELHKIQSKYSNISNKFQHHLQSIDIKNKKVTFLNNNKPIILDYDFIHIVPPMSPVDAIKNSTLVNTSGWLDIDKNTLQHKKYKNIFGIGDTCDLPIGKTGASTMHHVPVLTQNLIDVMQNKKPSKNFDGYTIFSINTEYKKSIMAEFNYNGAISTLPISYDKPRWIWWIFELYMLKPIYKYLILTGRFQ